MVIWQVKEFCQLNITVEAPEIHIYTYGTVDSVMGLLLRRQHPLRFMLCSNQGVKIQHLDFSLEGQFPTGTYFILYDWCEEFKWD